MDHIGTSFANLFAGGLLLLIGLVLCFVKGSEGMLAGYNTMSEAEQATWDATAMRLFVGKVLIITACILLIAGVLALLGFYPEPTIVVSWGIFFAIILFCVIYVNASRRFRRK